MFSNINVQAWKSIESKNEEKIEKSKDVIATRRWL